LSGGLSLGSVRVQNWTELLRSTLKYFAQQIGQPVPTNNCFTVQGGFTQFLVNREAEEFLEA
jgi:hypothetical protein